MGKIDPFKIFDPLGLFKKDEKPAAPPAVTPEPASAKVEGPTEEERRAGLENAAKRRARLAKASGARQFRIDLSSAGSTGSGISIPGRGTGRA